MGLRLMKSSFKNWGMAMSRSKRMVRAITTTTESVKTKTPVEHGYGPGEYLTKEEYDLIFKERRTIKPKNKKYFTTEEFDLATKEADWICNRAQEEAKKEYPECFVDDGMAVMDLEEFMDMYY